MKQPFAYYGGKQRLASKIIKYIPKHTVYVEPFCGGASVFWGKPWPEVTNNHHYREVLNDLNGDLINFFRVLQDKDTFDLLQHRLKYTPFSQDEHRLSRDILKNVVDSNGVDRAWAWFVQTNMSFVNKIFGGWGTGCYSRNCGVTWLKRLELTAFFERLMSTHISSEDAIRCLKRWNSPQSFAYIDPPYVGTDCGSYSGYTLEQYKELIDFLNDEWQGSFILSNYAQEIEPKRCEKVDFTVNCTARGRTGYDRTKKQDESDQNRKRTEVIYVRQNKVSVREEIQKLYDSGKFDCFK